MQRHGLARTHPADPESLRAAQRAVVQLAVRQGQFAVAQRDAIGVASCGARENVATDPFG